ncbi:hypothetical protein MSM1_19890 [Mycobacterium sp. SM1]|uniref:hypothetical protein n=1 Tax=Mycobacterium sp. SM1 TaxID=2816243 RepID=UPI001BCC5B1B|nr:hypothetical protein [Mycobacterium sp. SM1]MBS4730488.1 hypothetical protein [Mycobacterium sp. SM1]
MMQSADSGSHALPREDIIDRRRAGRPPDYKNPPWGARRPDTQRNFSRGDDVTEPLNAAEVAQAQLFEAVLRMEIAQLEQLARPLADRWMRLRRRRIGDDRPPAELVRLRAQIEEAYRLLATLRRRFLPEREWARCRNSPDTPRP